MAEATRICSLPAPTVCPSGALAVLSIEARPSPGFQLLQSEPLGCHCSPRPPGWLPRGSRPSRSGPSQTLFPGPASPAPSLSQISAPRCLTRSAEPLETCLTGAATSRAQNAASFLQGSGHHLVPECEVGLPVLTPSTRGQAPVPWSGPTSLLFRERTNGSPVLALVGTCSDNPRGSLDSHLVGTNPGPERV